MALQPLQPLQATIYSDRTNSVAGQLADMVRKRVGGGRVQLGLTTFDELARVLIKNEGGYDKQDRMSWGGQPAALQRIFAEYGWPIFGRAILIAVVRKWMVDPVDGFIPLGPGSLDVEAGLNIEADLHKEAIVWGTPGKPDTAFAEAVAKKVGLVTEYGNGDSLEFVVPFYTPGVWAEIRDTEFGRRTGVVVVTPELELYCEGLDINGLQPVPEKLLSAKVVEAIKIAKQLCRECCVK